MLTDPDLPRGVPPRTARGVLTDGHGDIPTRLVPAPAPCEDCLGLLPPCCPRAVLGLLEAVTDSTVSW